MYGQPLKVPQSVKPLGVFIDNHLNMKLISRMGIRGLYLINSIIQFYHINPSIEVPATKLKNLSDVLLILLGAVENDFQLDIQKEGYKIVTE